MKVTDKQGREREVVFWDCDGGAERLMRTTIKDAVLYGIDDMPEDETPETIDVFGFAPMVPPKPKDLAGDLVDFLIERMDCDYMCGPPDDQSEDTPGMREAALVFAAKFLEEFEVRSCEEVVTLTVNVKRALAGEYDAEDAKP